MTNDEVVYEKREGIARITMNRPEKLNALTPDLMGKLWDFVLAAEADDDVHVIILAGEGRCFSAGGDLNWLVDEPPLDAEEFLTERGPDPYVTARSRTPAIWDWFWEVSKPIIAQVHGYCLAGACEMAFFADLTIASEDALFGEPEAKNGWVPASMWLLGPKIARELLLLGDMVPAAEAKRMGLVNRVVPKDQLEAETEAIARKLCAIPRSSLAIVKRTGSRFYKAMGFQAVSQSVGEMSVYVRALQAHQNDEFNRRVKEQGLRAALAARDRGDTQRQGQP